MKKSAISVLISASIFLAIFLFLGVFSSTAHAQSTGDPYHQSLRTQLERDYDLTGGEWLFSDNEQANFDSIGTYGGSQKSIQSIDGQPFALAARLTQAEQLVKPWDAGAVLPNQSAVAEGDAVLITFWARGIDATVGHGYIRATFQDRTTFESSLFLPIVPTAEWQQIFVPLQIAKSNDIDDAIFGMQLGSMTQTVEMGGLTGINYGSSVDLADLPRTPPGNYAGQEADAAWRVAANERIDQHRKAGISVTVVDRNGTPIPNSAVTVQMQEHAFRFGSAVTLPNLLGSSPDEETYRQKLTNLDGNGHGFNAAVLEWGLQWLPWEGNSSSQYTPERMVEAFTLVKNMGMTMRAHSLVWGGWRWLPPDMEANKDDPAYLLQRIDERANAMLTYPGLAGEIFEWDIVNEPRFETELADALAGSPGFPQGDEINPHIFKLAESVDPNVRLFINETSILSDGGLQLGAHLRYHEVIQDLIDADARLDGIGLQSHMAYPLTAPERLYAILEDFAAYGKELHISEYDVEIEDEAKAGEYTRDFLTVAFSHRSVTGFTLWNFWDPVHWLRNAALFRADWSVKPSGAAIFDLLFNQWWTDESGATNGDGQYGTRGFLGSYQIEATYAGTTEQMTTTVVSGGNAITFTLDTLLPASPEPPVVETPQATVSLALTAPQIDGEIDEEWNQAPRYEIAKTALGDPTTADDLSASFRMMAADGFLYALVEVTDNELRNDSGQEWWEDDAVEIYLDGDRSQGTEYDGVNDAQLVFRWEDDAVIAGPNSIMPPADLDYRLIQTENGYRLEAKIPASAFDLPLIFGAQFGLDIHVIDDDGGAGIDDTGRERKIAWAASADEVWNNPSLMGLVVVRLESGLGFDAYVPLLFQ